MAKPELKKCRSPKWEKNLNPQPQGAGVWNPHGRVARSREDPEAVNQEVWLIGGHKTSSRLSARPHWSHGVPKSCIWDPDFLCPVPSFPLHLSFSLLPTLSRIKRQSPELCLVYGRGTDSEDLFHPEKLILILGWHEV